MSAGPRTKRPFAGAASDPAQRQITSFFNKTSSSTSNSSHAHPDTPATTAPLNGPALPAHVQSNLLSVGMRIRKAIPEGHKTGSPYSAFSLWSDMDGTKTGNSSSSDLRPVPTVPGGVPRELTPFCGIHKVGGLAVQPTITDSFTTTNSVPSSQESITSITSAMAMQDTSSAAINRKRFYVTEEEEDLQGGSTQGGSGSANNHNNIAWRNRADWLDGEISPRSLAPAEWGENSRILAVPRVRRRAGGGGKSGGDGGDDGGLLLLPPGASTAAEGGNQENMAADDFDEAPFLDYRIGGSGGDMDFE